MADRNRISKGFWRSWRADTGVHSFDELLAWVTERNRAIRVDIRRISLDDCSPWALDGASGFIRNANGSFFQVAGLVTENVDPATGEASKAGEQPVLLQSEIGYLGIVAKEFDGVVHFLMQAKIEPGNVNKVQLSPTIQATRSNFLQLHGGRRPAYLEYFLRDGSPDGKRVETVVDQVQSEQSSRFLGKRNRNVLVLTDEDVEVLPSHRWMTLGQIKRMMRYPNLVNMDTRTVLSGIPWSLWERPAEELVGDAADAELVSSVAADPSLPDVEAAHRMLNDAKMFDFSRRRTVPLNELSNWEFAEGNGVLRCRSPYPFEVGFFDIAIEQREVARWCQPLFEAKGIATFALLCSPFEGSLRFLVRVRREPGCFDAAELSPTLQREAGALEAPDAVESFVLGAIEAGSGVFFDGLLSEEGGRFYCEQNRNVLLRMDPDELAEHLPDNLEACGYLWLDFATLNFLVQANNVLNIQLRNLLALLDPWERPEKGISDER